MSERQGHEEDCVPVQRSERTKWPPRPATVGTPRLSTLNGWNLAIPVHLHSVCREGVIVRWVPSVTHTWRSADRPAQPRFSSLLLVLGLKGYEKTRGQGSKIQQVRAEKGGPGGSCRHPLVPVRNGRGSPGLRTHLGHTGPGRGGWVHQGARAPKARSGQQTLAVASPPPCKP